MALQSLISNKVRAMLTMLGEVGRKARLVRVDSQMYGKSRKQAKWMKYKHEASQDKVQERPWLPRKRLSFSWGSGLSLRTLGARR